MLGVAGPVMARRLEPVPAEVVRAPLEQRDVHGPAQHGAERGQIARIELILQRARARRDDRVAAGEQDGHEICIGFADARAGLEGGMAALLERLPDELGHLLLRGAICKARQLGSELSVRAEEFGERGHGP